MQAWWFIFKILLINKYHFCHNKSTMKVSSGGPSPTELNLHDAALLGQNAKF
jgi:hypothetical protein